MSVRFLIDMNLSPQWVTSLRERGVESVHWPAIGRHDAPDVEIMAWAREHNYAVFTHDLDFGTLLALTQATGPSVIQVRAQDVMPSHLVDLVARAIDNHEEALERGALIVVDEARLRVRVLPLA